MTLGEGIATAAFTVAIIYATIELQNNELLWWLVVPTLAILG